eukprot:gene100-10827_t
MKFLAAVSVLAVCTNAAENGLGRLPPQAWRSWNAFHENFNQSTIMSMVDEIVKPRPTLDAKGTTTLQKLGYNMVGIDEGWEGCGMGVNHTQHYVNGTPAVRADFPDIKALVDYGHSKGVKMGFYLNGCSCGEHAEHLINYEGDVNFTYAMGFDGVKIDSCGAQRNMTLPIIIENCHQGQDFPDGGDPGQMGDDWCPYNFFRTSGDIINVWDRVVENLMSVTKFLTKEGDGAAPEGRPLEPPIWFPPPPPGKFDLQNTTRLDLAWPTISNKRAMEVSQCWEEDRADPSGAIMKVWQAETIPAVVANCGASCSSQCVNKNVNCTTWAKDNQCTENPGYMRAIWQLPAADSGLNWLHPKKCNPKAKSQMFTYKNNQLVSSENGMCLGVESHWLWPQPMVSLVGCGGAKTNVTLHANGTLSSAAGFGCYGISNNQGPPSTVWRKPMPGGKTAVLAINGGGLEQEITIDVATMLAPDYLHTIAGKTLGNVSKVTRKVPPHGNIFIRLE